MFVHIPKTAGTTLRTILRLNAPGHQIVALGNVVKGSGGHSTALIRRLQGGEGPRLDGVRIVRGHFPLGVRDLLPRDREVRCFTFLREPVDRTLSHYFALSDKSARPPKGLSRLPANATLDDVLERGYIHDNLQTRMLSGLLEPFGKVTTAMLEQAKHNLREGLVLFGLAEHFDESLVLLRRLLGLQSILYGAHARVNPMRPRGNEIPEDLVQAAERSNGYDLELYRYAHELFEAMPERRDAEFKAECIALRTVTADRGGEVDTLPPAGFAGNAETWRMLVDAKARILRLEWELAGSNLPSVATTVAELERKVKELEAASRPGRRGGGRRPEAGATGPKAKGGPKASKSAATGPKRDAKRDVRKVARTRALDGDKPAGRKSDDQSALTRSERPS